MGRVQLIIDNQVADIYEAGDLLSSIGYSIGDINDIEKRSNPTSKSIKLPATARNKEIFGFADDVTVSSFRGQRTSMTGVIREEGTIVIMGVVNLKGFTQSGNDSYFEITIIGNSGEWINSMSDAELQGCSTDGSHYKDASNVELGKSGTLAWAYGLINNGYPGGQVKVSSIEDNGQGKALFVIDGTNRIYNLRPLGNILGGQYVTGYAFENSMYNKRMLVTSTIDGNDDRYGFVTNAQYMGNSSGVVRAEISDVRVEDMSLLINVEKLFTKIFTLAGYRISSTFLSSTFFKSLWILPGSEKQLPGWTESSRVIVGSSAHYSASGCHIISPYVFDTYIEGTSGLYDTVNGWFESQVEAKFINFKASFNIKGTTDYQAYARFCINGTPVPEQTNKIPTPVTLNETIPTILVQEAELRVKRLDKVTVEVCFFPMGGVYPDIYIYAEDTRLECVGVDTIINGSWIVPYNHLPVAKQIDFVKAIRHLFNLYFFTDMAMKTVYIEPRDTFFLLDQFIDLTDKLDRGQPVLLEELGADVAKRLTFRYKQDSADAFAAEYEKANGEPYSSHTETLLNKFAPNEEKVVENPMFAATLMDGFDSIGLPGSLLPKIWGEVPERDTYPEKLTEFIPRILFYAGTRDCEDGESWRFEGVTKTDYELFCPYDPEAISDTSLLFDPQPSIPDLYFKHYANYVRTLNYARKLTAYFKLTAKDIQFLTVPDVSGGIIKDFRSQVFARIGGDVVHCRLEGIQDYVAGKSQSTKVTLITDVDNISQIVSPFINSMTFTNDTILIGSPYANGTINRFGSVWNDVRGGSNGLGITQGTSYGVGSSRPILSQYRIERMFLFFDTSNLPNGATIVEAYLDVYKIGGSTQQEFGVFEGLQGTTLAVADYSRFGSVLLGQSAAGGWGLRRVYLNAAGIYRINALGWTKFALREMTYDYGNVAPAQNFSTFKTHQVNSPAQYLNSLTVKYTL